MMRLWKPLRGGVLLLKNRSRSRSSRPRVEFCEGRTLLSAVLWTGGAGTDNWDTAANWNTDSLPGSGDSVTIPSGATVVHSDNDSDSVEGLTSSGTLSVTAGTLAIASASTASTLTINGGTLTANASLSVGGTLSLLEGTLSGSGTVDALGGMTLGTATSTQFVLDGVTLDNAAGQSANFSGMSLENGAVFNNYGSVTGYGYLDGSSDETVNNYGSWTLTQDEHFNTLTFNVNGGTVNVGASQLVIEGAGSSVGGTFTTSTGGSINFDSFGTIPFTIDPTTTFSGDGGLTKDDILVSNNEFPPALVFAGSSTLSGPTTVDDGDFQVDGSQPGSAVTLTDGSVYNPTYEEVPTYLTGTGTVGAITANAATVVSPGDSPTLTGVLTADGNVDIADAVLDVALNGATAGSGYDQLDANGVVTLGRTDLNPTLGFTPSSGDVFTIIKSTSPIIGTFDSLPQGSTFDLGGITFTVNYTGGSSGDDVVLTPSIAAATATTTSLSTSQSTANVGQSVTFTAVVAPGTGTGTPTGTVTFSIDGQAQTPVDLTVVGGADLATFSTTTLAVGSHTIGAAYSGDTTFAASTANPLTQTVDAPTTTTLTSSASSSLVGQSVTFTATVSGPSGAGTPSGSVSLQEGSTILGIVPLSAAGQATFTASSLALGSDSITAVYAAAGSFLASSSAPLTHVVTAASTPPPVTSSAPDGPKVTLVQRYGYHMMPTSIVLTFDQALDDVLAEDADDYSIIGPAGQSIAIRSAVYNPETLTVTLRPSQRISVHKTYELTVDGTAPHGLTNRFGQLLDGKNTGRPDSDYRTTLTWRELVLDPVPAGMARWARRATGRSRLSIDVEANERRPGVSI
jgi:hypothetical protein